MRISEDTFGTLNASKHAVTLPEEAGGGRMALYEGFHLVHCVVSLYVEMFTRTTHSIAENVVACHIPGILPEE